MEGGKKAYLTAKKLFEKGIKMGLSMGYKTMKYINETIDGIFVRKLKEVKLREGALTLFPMDEGAGLEGIKSDEVAKKERGCSYCKDTLILKEPDEKSTQRDEPHILSPVIEVLERERDKPHKHLLSSTIEILERNKSIGGK